jgi:hypothetical protein
LAIVPASMARTPSLARSLRRSASSAAPVAKSVAIGWPCSTRAPRRAWKRISACGSMGFPGHHPSDENLSLGTPDTTPATKTCRWGPRTPPQRRRPVAGDPGHHPSDEDLSLGTPAGKSHWAVVLSEYSDWRTAIAARKQKRGESGAPQLLIPLPWSLFTVVHAALSPLGETPFLKLSLIQPIKELRRCGAGGSDPGRWMSGRNG